MPAVLPAVTNALDSIAAIEAFFRPDDTRTAREYRHFDVTGTVQGVIGANVILQDDAGERTFFTNSSKAPAAPGDRIVLSGAAYYSYGNEQSLIANALRPLGKASPDAPLKLALNQLDESVHNLRRVVVTGTVTEVRDDEIDPNYTQLIIREGSDTLPLFAHASVCGNATDLMDATVRADGFFMRSVDGQRRFSGPFVNVRSLAVERPSDTDPFLAPRLNTFFYQTPRDLLNAGRRTVAGRVLAVWGGNRFLLRTRFDQLVIVECLEHTAPPAFGSTVLATGYPDTNRFHLILTRARFRPEAVETADEELPRHITATEIFRAYGNRRVLESMMHGRLVTLVGVVRSVPPAGSPNRIAHVECQGFALPVDFSAAPTALDNVAIGSRVALTGRCVLSTEMLSLFNSHPRLTQATLVLRSGSDVTVLSGPGWWTPGRLTAVIGLLFAALVALFVRFVLQKRLEKLKVAERTRLAVELHDSMSQALAGLACQVAATGDALGPGESDARDKLATAVRMLKSCRTELKNCLFDLRSDTMGEKDFAKAVRRTLEALSPYASVSVRFKVRRELLGDTVAHATLSIVRELVANAVRHGAADTIHVAGVTEDGNILFSVRDDGCGFDPERCDGIATGHYGLNGIRERVASLAGSVAIRSAPGRGTKVTVTLPLSRT